jgi:hypothetical protein
MASALSTSAMRARARATRVAALTLNFSMVPPEVICLNLT